MVYDNEEKVVTVMVTYDNDVLNATVSMDTDDGTTDGENASLTFRNVKKEATLDGDKGSAHCEKTLTRRGLAADGYILFTANDDETKKAEVMLFLNGVQVDDVVLNECLTMVL